MRRADGGCSGAFWKGWTRLERENRELQQQVKELQRAWTARPSQTAGNGAADQRRRRAAGSAGISRRSVGWYKVKA